MVKKAASTNKAASSSANKTSTIKATSSSANKTSTIKTRNANKNLAYNPYKNNGIAISPNTFSAGDKVKITYTGLLSKSGATEVFAHIGWGHSWLDVSDVKMSKTKSGFTATVTAYDSLLNVCFKDVCNNWDNNNGDNYTISVSK